MNFGKHLLENPNGTYSFFGTVDARLVLATMDGGLPTEEQIKNAKHVGVTIAGLKTRVFQSEEDALEFEASLN
ncbi:hypothetical protein Q7A53_05760 [Halobacillus rhizosphaerae]|uniref:hypothetical protein n=1 Tax=Halobacillus rhizosphaerae TaxID=3064889 RepID=UPI00398BB0E7